VVLYDRSWFYIELVGFVQIADGFVRSLLVFTEFVGFLYSLLGFVCSSVTFSKIEQLFP
jgi:hypothetical protein